MKKLIEKWRWRWIRYRDPDLGEELKWNFLYCACQLGLTPMTVRVGVWVTPLAVRHHKPRRVLI